MNIRSMLMRAICAATNRFTPSGGVMTHRPAVLVRVVVDDGLSGWGEVWCNFPSAGANQAWELDEARAMLPALEPFELRWLEEPLRADRPWAHWLRLRELSRIPLAAGENIAGEAGFAAALASGALRVVQPDIAEWGGFSACLSVARAILAAGSRFCPHYLGASVGLLASAHLLATAGGDGWLEIDANPNPLRTLLCGPLAEIREGSASLGEAAGLGVEPDLGALDAWRRPH